MISKINLKLTHTVKSIYIYIYMQQYSIGEFYAAKF